MDSPAVVRQPVVKKRKVTKPITDPSTPAMDSTSPTSLPSGIPSKPLQSSPVVKSRTNQHMLKVKPCDCVNYNGKTYILARAFEDKYKLKKMLETYETETGESAKLFLQDDEFKKLKAENPENLSVFAYRTSLYTMEFVNYYKAHQ